MSSFISEQEVEKALDYLRDSAASAAKARAERIYVEEYRKVIKSLLMKEAGGNTAVTQERDAYANPRYLQHLEAIREAVELDERLRFLRVAAEAKIEAWRTQCSNERAMKL